MRRRRAGVVEPERRIWVVALLYGGILLTIVLLSRHLPEDMPEHVASILSYAAFLMLGVVAVRLLGPGALRESLAGPPSVRWLLVGALTGPLLCGVAIGYVTLLAHLFDSTVGGAEMEPLWLALVVTAVLPALVEEWVARGVLWTALRPFATRWGTILATALIFAFMHGLQGFPLALPHRFLGGVALGWLRDRSGSLAPPMLAHFAWNALATLLA